MKDIRSSNSSAKQIGNFLQIIRDSSCYIGCAASASASANAEGTTSTVFECSYSDAPIEGKPAYVEGPTASQCVAVSIEYPGLCAA